MLITLDALIGLLTLYLLLSLMGTALVEFWCTLQNKRGLVLERAFSEFLHGGHPRNETQRGFKEMFFDHPLVQSLSEGDTGRPAYIEPTTVARVVADLVCQPNPTASLQAQLQAFPEGRIKQLLQLLQQEAGEDRDKFHRLIAEHYQLVTDRSSGWYKRYTQWTAFAFSLVIAIPANIDSLDIYETLLHNASLRSSLVQTAETLALPPSAEASLPTARPTSTTVDHKPEATAALASLTGWANHPLPQGVAAWWKKCFGLLLSALAISLGAPFWFDMLNRVMQIRVAGVSPEEKKK